MRSEPTIAIIVPSYNEPTDLTPLLCELETISDRTVLVIDGPPEPRVDWRATAVQVIRHSRRRGIGEAVKIAAELLASEFGVTQSRNTWVGIVDADGQHPVDAVEEGILQVRLTAAPLIIGRRCLSRYPRWRVLGNRVMDGFARCVTGHPLTDVESGLKFVRLDLLAEVFRLLPRMTAYSFSIQLNVAWAIYYGLPRYFDFTVPHFRGGRTNLSTAFGNLTRAVWTAHRAYRYRCIHIRSSSFGVSELTAGKGSKGGQVK